MSELDNLFNQYVSGGKAENKPTRAEFKPLILDDDTQDIDANKKDQQAIPQYVDVDKVPEQKFVQPERRSYFVAGNVNNNEINTTAQKPNEIEYEANTIDDEKKKDDYFALTKLSTNKKDIVKNAIKYITGAANPIQSAINTVGAFTGKDDKEIVLEGVRGFTGSTIDFASSLYRFFKQNTDIAKTYTKEQLDKIANLGNVMTGGESFANDIAEQYTEFYKQIDEENKILRDKTERFLQYTGIAKTDKDGFIYDLVGGGASLMYAIGIAAITKSPVAAAEMFGMYQYQSLYEEGIDRGFSPIKARAIGVAGGAFEAGLEMVGLHVLIETLKARRSFTKILKAALTEFTQEASQQGAEEILAKLSGLREDSTVGQIISNVFYAGVIGAILGGGSATVSNVFYKQISDSATRELINNGMQSDYAKQMVDNVLKLSVSPQAAQEVVSISKDEQSPVTYKNADPRETYKETGEAIKKALDPAQKRGVELELIQANKKLTQELANVLLNSGKAQNGDDAYRRAEQVTAMYDVLAREAYNQEGIRPEDYYKRFHVNAQSGNIEIDERNVDEDNPFVDVSFDPVDFDPEARAEYEAAMDAEQDYMDQVEKENKTTLKKEARILGDMGIDAIRRPTPDGVGKDRWGEYKDLSNRIKNYFFSDDPTAMSWDDAQKLLETSSSSIKDLFAYLAAVDDRAVTLNQPGVFNRVLAKEKERIKQQAIADGTFLKAPNGKDSNLSEQLWLIVRTKAFKNWFGDWLNDPQNASKVVDENGEPLVVYHGTLKGGFKIFKNSKKGVWFANEDVAGDYGWATDEETGEPIRIKQSDIEETQGVYPVFLNIRNPLTVDFQGKGALDNEKAPSEIFEENISDNNNYDGMIVNNVKDYGMPMGATTEFYKAPHSTYAIKNSNQIKSINNRGNFDRRNPDIYLQKGIQENTIEQKTKQKFDTILKTTAKDLIEVRTRKEIQDKLQKMFGTYEELDAYDEGEDNDVDKYISVLANEYMAELEYSANERDYDAVQGLLDRLKKDVVEISKRKDYNNVDEKQKENSLSNTSRSSVLRSEKSTEGNLYSDSAKTDLQVKDLSIDDLKNINDDIVLYLFTNNKVVNDLGQNFNTSELDKNTIKFIKNNGIKNIDENGVYINVKQQAGDEKEWQGKHRSADVLKEYARDAADRGFRDSAKYYLQQRKKLAELQKQLENLQEKLRVYIAKNSPKQNPQQQSQQQSQQSQIQLQSDMQQLMLEIFNQPAWHGGPRDFENFDLSFALTGEGAMAHGYGVYLAGLRKIAEKYRQKLIEKKIFDYFANNGYEFAGIDEIEQIIDDGSLKIEDKEILEFINALREDDWLGFSNIYEAIRTALRYKENSKNFPFSERLKKAVDDVGQVFQVDIPENDVLLDEQKTLDKQPDKVKESLNKLFRSKEFKEKFFGYVQNYYVDKEYLKLLGKYYDVLVANFKENNSEEIHNIFEEIKKFRQEKYYLFEDEDIDFEIMIEQLGEMDGLDEAVKGEELYDLLTQILGSKKEASLLLNKYGIKGINYHGGIDGQAYVIFNDKAIKILEKYYQDQEQQQQEQPRGSITSFDRQYWIDLFSGSDKSTLLHEGSHGFLSEVLYFARSKNASKKVLEIKKRLDEWLGEPEDNGRYSKRQQELFAGSSEVYFMEGKAPTPKLKTVFERFKKWLSDIYDRIKDDLPNISNDVRELFDTILSRSYNVPDSNIYAGKEAAIKEVIKNIQEGRASEVDGITIDDVYNLLNVAYTRKPSKPSKNLKQLLNDKNIYDFNELNKAGADTVLQILKDGGYVKADATTETAMDLARKALDGEPVYRLADQWRVAGDIDFARNLRVLERVIEFSQIDSTIEKILELQEEGYRNVEQGDVEQVQNDYKRLFSADVKEAKKIVEDIINRLHKKRFIDRAAQKQMIVDLNFSSTVEEIKESVLNVIEDLQDEIKLVKEQLRNPRKPIVRKDKTIPPGKNATEEEKNNYKKYMRKQINRLLKQVLPSKQNNNKVSKFGNIEIQRFFEELIRINKMSREEAERFAMDRIAKDNEWILKDEKGEGFENKQKIINMFVSYKSKIITQNSPELLKELYDNLQKINIAGRNEKQINDYLTKAKRNKDIDELLDNIDKNGSKSKVSKWIKTFYNYAVANWYSCINSIAGEKQAEKDALELLEKDVMVKAKTITNRIITRSCKALGLKTTKQFDEKIHEYLKEEHEFIQSKIDRNGKEVQRKQTFNKMELICCYIWSKNKQLKERIIRAYGNEQFNEMMAKLDKGDIAWGDIIQEETASLYDDVNKVYVKMYGLDMPQTENYFPSTTVRIQGNMDLLKDAIIQTSSPSFLKGRVDSNLVVMKFGNPINIAFNHIAKASRYAVMQEKLADICKAYLHPDVSDKLKDVYGSDKIFDYITKMLDNIKFTNFTKQVDIVNDMLNAAANTYVMTRIAGKISIMIKQLLSFTNYIEDVDSALWLKHFGKMISNPFKFKQIKEFMYKHSPYLKLRYESGAQNEALEKAMEAEAKTILKIKTFKGMLTLLTRVGDIGAIIFGGYPMIQAQLEKGVPIEKAFENFEKATLRSQQANFSSTLSNWQNYCKQNAFLRAIFAFTNTPNQYTRKLVDICFKMAHGDESFINGKGFKTLVLYGVVQSLLYNSFTSLALLSGWFGGDWDDLKDDVWLSLFQVSNFLAFPILGQIYNQVVTMYVTGDYVQDKRVPIIDDMTAFFKAMKKAYDDGFGEMGIEDWINVTDKLASITTGIPLKTLYNSYITSWGDIINGDYGKGFVKLYGATESRANKIFD